MKKFVFAFVILTINLLMVSCFQQSLDSVVERMREKLPAAIAEGQVLKDVVVTGDYLQFEVEYDESDQRLDGSEVDLALALMGDQLKKSVLDDVDEDGLEVFKICVKDNKGIRFIMDGLKSKKKLTLLEIDANELAKEIENRQ